MQPEELETGLKKSVLVFWDYFRLDLLLVFISDKKTMTALIKTEQGMVCEDSQIRRYIIRHTGSD